MANARGEKDYLNLVKGLNTETNPLAFPEGYTLDELNFLLSLDGDTRLRRKGLAKVLSDITYNSVTGEVLNTPFMYYWEKEEILLVVLQEEGEDVYLQLRDARTGYSLIGTYTMYSGISQISKPSFSSIVDGVVITTSQVVPDINTGGLPPIVVKANTAGDIEVSEISLYFRDFELLDDNLAVGKRPNLMTDEHLYNLYNAGWYARRKNSSNVFTDPLDLFDAQEYTTELLTFDADAGTNTFTFTYARSGVGAFEVGTDFTVANASDPTNNGTFTVVSSTGGGTVVNVEVASITVTESGTTGVTVTTGTGQFPSNSDIPVLGLKADGSGNEVFTPDTLFETVNGNTEAPRGHYVYEVYGDVTARDTKLLDNQIDGTPSTTVTLKATITR